MHFKSHSQSQSGRAAISALIVVLLVGAGVYFIENINQSLTSVIDSANRLSAMVSGNRDLDKKTVATASKDTNKPVNAGEKAGMERGIVSSRHAPEFLAQISAPSDFVPSNAEGKTESAPFSRINLPEMASGQRAVDLLGDQLQVVAQWYGFSPEALRALMLQDLSIHIDRQGRLLHIDDGVNEKTLSGSVFRASEGSTFAPTASLTGDSVSNAIYALDQTFKLHSKSNSTRILYLNFKGLGAKPPFDLDKNTGTFSNAEMTMIQKIWARVKEDYSPFDVDVTTELPANLTGKIGASILITNQVSDAGGYAYLNSFGTINLSNPPAFCFQNNLGNAEKPIAECISHELGHTLGLNHQGTASVTYYGGQGDGETGWAPIMGVSYYKNLTQWAKGEYNGANNTTDAYGLMGVRGLGYRTDDVADNTAGAAAMTSTIANGLNNLSTTGIIERVGDGDMFKFSAGAGNVSFNLAGSLYSGNLDANLQLLDSTAKVLSTSNNAATLGTTLTYTLPAAGTYYLRVSGAGKGDPKTTGYSTYGSLGQYIITGTAPQYVTTPPVLNVTTSALTGRAQLRVNFDASKSTAMSGAQVTKYEWVFGDGTANATTAVVAHIYSKVGTYNTTIKITDSNNQTKQTSYKVTVTN
ncbi:PKD domain-containing protein [Undibacterium fentianense]|uniref:Pre-peptidase C-terminal domain-containing protein n=1 Tax=Undibacterium fentianense TaxID=2828728 RepID=A0A941ICM6_9BURK|nr:PKD domain-containing protein [Undibacterium fentianense]MBR7800359.1 pre-peptidase C-terminal domain-containing protein [Undibacterium fentianense]